MKFLYYSLLIIFLAVSSAKASPLQDSIPTHDSFTITSEKVGETRTINVWVPEGYTKNTDALPVMYMADGGIKEDFPHIANTFAKLINAKSIPPIILVGIENTQRRRDLTGFTEVAEDKTIAPVVGGAEKFRAFIKDELFPEIGKRYHISNKRGILGESLSGLFVMETLMLKPDMFDYYIAFDPSLWWNNHNLVNTAKQHLKKLPQLEKTLWFAGSGTKGISEYTQELANILKSENYKHIKWKYIDKPEEQHDTIFKATKEEAIYWTLEKIN